MADDHLSPNKHQFWQSPINKRLVEASWWAGLAVGESGSCSDGPGHAQEIFNPVFCWWGWGGGVPSLWFGLRPNYGRGNGGNGNLLQKDLCPDCCIQCSQQHSRPLLTQASTTDSLDTHRQVWLSLLWDHLSFLLGPGMYKVLFVPSKSLFPQFCGSSIIKSHWPSKKNSLGVLSPFTRSLDWEISCGP